MAEQKIGVAIAGTGFGQKIHLPGFQHHHRTEVVSIYNRDLAKAQSIAEAHGVAHWGDRLEDVLNNPAVDAVAVSTPPFLHYVMAKQVLEAGKHLLLEKPITLNAAEAKELYQIAAAKNLVVTPDFEFRFVPAWQVFAEYLHNDFVGKKRLITINWIVTSRANPDRAWNWYALKSQGGGALGAVGSHAFDYINWLFGGVKRISGHLSCAIKERPDPNDDNKLKPVDADDTCLIMLELADGTPCQLNISSVTYHGRGHWVEVYGEKGSLVLGSSNLKDYVHGFTLQAGKAGEELTEVSIPEKYQFPKTFDDGRLAPFIRVVDHFAKCIGENNAAIAPTLKEGVYSQLLMDLTHKSNDEGRWLDVPNLDQFLAG
ncbi:Gfo/Idh/MocA family protein [[Limnothrix rosea] IAM M-220]|uniref:Gfo/Idh/MocA family protein n=1 Tax=[Limnothrix rosea] IAM M-220 TaxID=454133 RepID=UPI000966765B|nr:Gfo/Idh/MocA family oxidoreductase [[Limnothrix rosea] IAM M-220]OKH15074.1 oxidoreductase [[Limnothrix rosea] IAM M-220]